jgi:F420-non-reducing hydrogenase iron-sulfur subunit
MKYPANARVIRLMCSGRVDPQFVLDAFARGADGVLLGGCHPGDCHYQSGNTKALRRFRLLRRVLGDLGIEERRIRLEWISASEADKLRRVMTEMIDEVRALGPLRGGAAELRTLSTASRDAVRAAAPARTEEVATP